MGLNSGTPQWFVSIALIAVKKTYCFNELQNLNTAAT